MDVSDIIIDDITLSDFDDFVKDDMAMEEKKLSPAQIIDVKIVEPLKFTTTTTKLPMPVQSICAYKPCYICPYCGTSMTEKENGLTLIDSIFEHLALHRNEFFQCYFCNKILYTESEMMNHMLHDHPNQMMQMYHNTTSSTNSISINIITSHIECGICLDEISTPHQAFNHFASIHMDREFQMRAIQVIKKLVKGSAPNWTIGETKWPLRPIMVCLRCHFTGHTVIDMIKHHSDKHALTYITIAITNTLAVLPEAIESKLNELNSNAAFCCVHCHDKGNNFKLYCSAKEVYVHWTEEHMRIDNPLSFQFYVTKLMACFYCNFIASYEGICTHFQENHPNTMFAVIHIANRSKCGICDSIYGRIDEHFKIAHDTLAQTAIPNPFLLSDEYVDELVAIHIHMKMKCVHPGCNKAFDSKYELKKHRIDIHNDHSTQSYCQTFRDFTNQTFVDCCKMYLGKTEYLKHFNDHRMRYICSMCKFDSNDVSIISQHEHSVHGIVDSFKERYLDHMKVCFTNYWRTKIIFGNGLVLYKYNLLATKKYNDLKEYEAIVNTKMQIERRKYEELMKNEQMPETKSSCQSSPEEILIIE